MGVVECKPSSENQPMFSSQKVYSPVPAKFCHHPDPYLLSSYSDHEWTCAPSWINQMLSLESVELVSET